MITSKYKITNKLIAIVLALCFMVCLLPGKAYAIGHDSQADPSDKLEVYVHYNNYDKGEYKHVKTLDVEYLKNNLQTAKYCFVDSLPTVVNCEARGVYIKDILNYCGLNTQFRELNLYANDGAKSTMTYNELYNNRYFYPHLGDLNEEGLFANCSPVGNASGVGATIIDYEGAMKDAVPVEPMFAYETDWHRVMGEGTAGAGNFDDSTRFRLVLGMEDLSSASNNYFIKAAANRSIRWVNRVEVVINTDDPNKSEAVKPDANSQIKLDKSKLDLKVDATAQLKATLDNAIKDQKIKWSSADEKVAKVNENGLVTAIALGKTIITVETADGKNKASCTVNVAKKDDDKSKDNDIDLNLKDIDNHWAKNNIEKLVKIGAVNGNPDGTFKPNNDITRAEFVTILIKLMVKEDLLAIDPSVSLKDTSDHWSNIYFSTAVANEIIKPLEDKTVSPDRKITREEIASILARALNLKATKTSSFNDQKNISSWAIDDVAALVENGGIEGYPDKTFKPKNNATRAEAATAIVRTFVNAGKDF